MQLVIFTATFLAGFHGLFVLPALGARVHVVHDVVQVFNEFGPVGLLDAVGIPLKGVASQRLIVELRQVALEVLHVRDVFLAVGAHGLHLGRGVEGRGGVEEGRASASAS